MEPILGQIILFAGNFAPVGWAFCHGQLLSIATNSTLFSILGTTYGGDGKTNFALPDLRGAVPIGFGQGVGLTHHELGERGGTETVALTEAQLPAHHHALRAVKADAATRNPAANLLAKSRAVVPNYAAPNPSAVVVMNDLAISETGGGQPHNNMPPFLAMNYIIALQGIFPSRS
jgi:microcystin-dependent protein